MTSPRSIAGVAGAVVCAGIAGCALGDDPSGADVSIWTDGSFDDWVGVPATVTDPPGDAAPGSPVDLVSVSVRDDARFIHLLIDLGDTVTVQGMPGTVEVVLNVDGDVDTGAPHGGVEGADLTIVLSRQREPATDVHGAGVGVRRIGEGGLGEMAGAAMVGLIVSPTHSSDRFEVRLDRAGVRGEGHVGESEAAGADGARSERAEAGAGEILAGRLRYLRADAVIDETPVFTHALATDPGEGPPLSGTEAVARTPGALRVVTWNVSDGNFRDRPEAFRRVLAVLAPDVLLLDEVYAEVTLVELARFGERLLAGEEGPGWDWWLATGGGRQRTVVGARGLGLRGEADLARVDHEPGALEGWLREVGDEPEAPRMPPPSRLARAEADGGMSTTGAWVTVDGRDILFVPVDLQSAGYDGSPRDRLRELQARTLNRALASVLASRPDVGVVVGGDLNLVGSARPLAHLRSGLGSGGDDLGVARLPRLRDRSLVTWRATREGDPFSPGRLDYVLYRESVLQVERAFVFDAADLSPEALRLLGVRASDTLESDHLPLVVDFRVRQDPASPGRQP